MAQFGIALGGGKEDRGVGRSWPSTTSRSRHCGDTRRGHASLFSVDAGTGFDLTRLVTVLIDDQGLHLPRVGIDSNEKKQTNVRKSRKLAAIPGIRITGSRHKVGERRTITRDHHLMDTMAWQGRNGITYGPEALLDHSASVEQRAIKRLPSFDDAENLCSLLEQDRGRQPRHRLAFLSQRLAMVEESNALKHCACMTQSLEIPVRNQLEVEVLPHRRMNRGSS